MALDDFDDDDKDKDKDKDEDRQQEMIPGRDYDPKTWIVYGANGGSK